MIWLTPVMEICADDLPVSAGPEATFEVDRIAVNQLGTVREYLRVKQWKPAIDLLQPLMEERGDSLYRVSFGRWMNVRRYCHFVISQMPLAGLQAYRYQVDTRARQLFEAGRARANDDLLRQVVRDAFCSSYGDDSLLLLADRAWERGDFTVACENWTLLLPADERTADAVIRYPDPSIPVAQVRARLVLCQLARGNIAQARNQLAVFQTQHADAVGQLAGRSGRLTDVLQQLILASDQWPARRSLAREDSFAGNRQRDRIEPDSADVGGVRWQIPLHSSRGFLTEPASRDAFGAWGPRGSNPLVFPVVTGGRLFVCDAQRIRGWELRSGRPAWWPTDVPLDETRDEQLQQATIFPATQIAEQLATPRRPVRGSARYSLTVVNDRLYARMGLPVTVRASDELQIFPSQLVCLDLGQGQGKVVWTCPAESVARQWTFEGAPIVVDSHLYVLLRKMTVESQLNVVCLDIGTGRPIWNQTVCTALLPSARTNNLVSQLLLTAGGNRLFVSTQLGAIAAMDRFDGVLDWVVADPRSGSVKSGSAATHRTQRPPSPPCVFHSDRVLAAAHDSGSVLAIDSGTGVVLWRTELRDQIDAILGVGQGRVIVSGRSLWGLDLQSGAVVWGAENRDPEYAGFGRGLLVADSVWWPRRRAIEIRSQATGRPLRQPINMTHRGAHSGNLLIRDGLLVVTSREHLTVFAPHPVKRRGANPLLSQRP
ncbi:MAG: PQQ-binding-like beta-propeller repeat protein [Planctomycetaceae bacterium]